MTERDDVPVRVSTLLSLPARWALLAAEYDGRERTLQVFDAPAREQRALMRRLLPELPDLERVAGGPIVVIFHRPDEALNQPATLRKPLGSRLHSGLEYPSGTEVRLIDVVQRSPALAFIGVTLGGVDGETTEFFDVPFSDIDVPEPDAALHEAMQRADALSELPAVTLGEDVAVDRSGTRLPRTSPKAA